MIGIQRFNYCSFKKFPFLILFFAVSCFLPETTLAQTPDITSPTPGSTFTSSAVTFTWTANNSSIDEWWLSGTTVPEAQAQSVDIFDSGSLGLNTSYTANGLPTDGSAVYVQLWYRIGNNWGLVEHQYTATTQASSSPEMTSPTPGTTLTGSSATFTWTANTTPVTEWAIQGGNTVDSGDLFNDGGTLGTNTSFTATNLPTDGRTIFVELFYLTNGTWQVLQYQYTAAQVTPPAMTSPTPGTTLTGSSVTFTWTANTTPVTEWAIQGGNTVDSGDLFNDGGTLGTNTSFTATNLPIDGRTIFVELFYLTNGTWQVLQYQYTATQLTPPAMTSPTPGTTFTGSSVIFTWTPNTTPVTQWAIQGGNTVDSGDLFDDGGTLGTNTSFTATNLPTDGRTIFVELFYLANGTWQVLQYQYTAATQASSPPEITNPTPGTTFTGSSVTFAWSDNGTPVTEWWLSGTSVPIAQAQSVDIFDSGSLGLNTSYTATGLPTNGSTVYVQLWYMAGGNWEVIEYQYTAATIQGSSSPEITSPTPSTTFTGSSVTFAWTDNGIPVTEWWLSGMSVPVAQAQSVDIFDSGSLGLNTSYTATGLPTDGSFVYVQLWFLTEGNWDYVEYQYTAAANGLAITFPKIWLYLPLQM